MFLVSFFNRCLLSGVVDSDGEFFGDLLVGVDMGVARYSTKILS